jgi:GNAT superfamily N-acetyltransferase
MGRVELDTLDGPATRAQLEEIQQVYAAAFPDYDLGDHQQRTLRQAESPGFTTVTARVRGELAGFANGLPLRSPAWWDGLEPPPDAGFTTETGTRTFAVIDLAVLPSQRGQGLGRRLMDELLQGRTEERATLATSPREPDVQAMYERWGWRKAGRTPGGEGETEPDFDLYVIALR